jgi:hypothetical protein
MLPDTGATDWASLSRPVSQPQNLKKGKWVVDGRSAAIIWVGKTL